MTSQLQTNWCVLTGGPCVGKTTTLQALGHFGQETRPESARLWIDHEMSRGKPADEIRANSMQFQMNVLRLQVEAEVSSEPKSRIFWDRGIPDTMAYMDIFETTSEPARDAALNRRYSRIFVLDPLPLYQMDYARFENLETAKLIHDRILQCYQELKYEIVEVPVLPILERAQFILNNLASRPSSSAV